MVDVAKDVEFSEFTKEDFRTTLGQSVRLTKVTKSYDGIKALDEVDIEIEPGSFTVLLGPSGSGKTTLLKSIAGIIKPDSGSVMIGHNTVFDNRTWVPPEKRELSMVFQDFALWPHMTAVNNVAFALKRRKLPRESVKNLSRNMMEKVGLLDHVNNYPDQLSGGEQQRVALARALVAQVGVVLFDEPMSNLDTDRREILRFEISTLIHEYNATAIYITHDQSEAFSLADKIAVLDKGKIQQYDTPENIYKGPASAMVARFTGISGELPVKYAIVDDRTDGAKVIVDDELNCKPISLVATNDLAHGKLKLFIRPTALKIVQPTPLSTLTGIIVDVSYCGKGYEHVIKLPDKSLLTKVFSENRFNRDELVGIMVDPSGCLLLKDD